MRAVSLVPSWTETLIAAGINVVGRTRYCIHPADQAGAIPVIGGTKDWNWDLVRGLKPDILVLDREENPRCMAEQSEFPYVDTHIRTIQDLPENLEKLGRSLAGRELTLLADRWRQVLARPALRAWDGKRDFPGLLEWGRRPQVPLTRVEYVIWRRPWMGISKDTFIGSVLSVVGFDGLLERRESAYPELDLENRTDKDSTLLLFSSEPYPFLRMKDQLGEVGFPYALVDGESFSWFGIRSLKFLETALK